MKSIVIQRKCGNLTVVEYNTKITTFSNGVEKYQKTSFSSLKGITPRNQHNGTSSDELLEYKTKKYLKKVRGDIVDLAFNYSNWEYFITLTFDFREIGEYSHDKAIELLKKWINNQKKHNKNMTYLLVPEFHKSGRLHFHGIVSNVPKWKFTESYYPSGKKIIINGLQIYNLNNYKLGFTTISKIQDQEKVSNYISKYATKELITIRNKKRYWYSKNLEKPKKSYEFIDTSLEKYLVNRKLSYLEVFKRLDCNIEVAQTQLPIIDIMLTCMHELLLIMEKILSKNYKLLYFLI